MEYWALSRQIVFLPVRLSFCLLLLLSLLFFDSFFLRARLGLGNLFFWFQQNNCE